MLPPPPGLQPLDFSKWSLPLPEAPVTRGLPTPSGGPPGIRQAHGPRDRRPQHYRCSHQVLPREHCRLISQDHPSWLHLPSKQHSCRASPLPLMSSQCSHQASLLHHTSWLCSHPGGQQEGDCWLDLLQMDPPLPLTLSTWIEEDNRLGDGASEADQPVTPDGDEG